MKTCYVCHTEKQENEFLKNKNKCTLCAIEYRKLHYKNNKEKINRQQKNYYQDNKKSIISYQRTYYYSNAGKINSILGNASRRAKKKSIQFNLTKEWVINQLEKQNYCCNLTKIPFIIEKTKNKINPYMPSLDRIDSSKGYTIDNVRIICAALNLALNEFGEETFKIICESYLKQR